MQHISSRQALDASTRTLLDSAATLSDGDLTTVGGDLVAVAGVLRRSPALRRTLSEATTSEQTRSELVARLLSGKVHQVALDVTTDAVRRSWATGADLRDGIERIGRTAIFLAAERAGELDEVEDQLFRFGRVVDAHPELSVLLDDPATDPDGRRAMVSRLLQGKANPLTLDLVGGLAADTGGRSFSHGIGELVAQAAERKRELVATVQSATELSEEQRRRLADSLQRIYSQPVSLFGEVDPTLVGGLRITVGDEVIDGSVAGRLDDLRRRLAG